jgi:hypothetical protein
MALSKKSREAIFNKYGGRCAYCGCTLAKGWHADHLKPIRRKMKYCSVQQRDIPTGELRYPKREVLENYNPACASCNINKHSMSLEEFRNLVGGFLKSLNRDSTQYKIAKRYGFIIEVEQPVVFYFEKVRTECVSLEKDHSGSSVFSAMHQQPSASS